MVNRRYWRLRENLGGVKRCKMFFGMGRWRIKLKFKRGSGIYIFAAGLTAISK